MKKNIYRLCALAAILSSALAGCSDDGGGNPAPRESAYISKVYDFTPAVGQFTNELPAYKDGDTRQAMIAKAEELIKGEKPKGMISLGGFGGYVVFGFDHMVENVEGYRDFRILGNVSWADDNPNPDAPRRGGSCEPGIIMVSYDANANGQPDDAWYEIAGSEYGSADKGYRITYHKPESGKQPVTDAGKPYATDLEYIYWEDNRGNSGYKIKNIYHTQSYWPQWESGSTITFEGTRLPDNGVDESGDGTYWVLYPFGFGYADNVPNGDDESAIDIGWAVGADGNPADLPGIHFVKVYCGVNQECGWIGETSTEIAGACDLHMLGIAIETRR